MLENYLQYREQSVVLNGQTSACRKTNSGFPQKSVLGPLLFLIYINDLPDGLTSTCEIVADDLTFFQRFLI